MFEYKRTPYKTNYKYLYVLYILEKLYNIHIYNSKVIKKCLTYFYYRKKDLSDNKLISNYHQANKFYQKKVNFIP